MHFTLLMSWPKVVCLWIDPSPSESSLQNPQQETRQDSQIQDSESSYPRNPTPSRVLSQNPFPLRFPLPHNLPFSRISLLLESPPPRILLSEIHPANPPLQSPHLRLSLSLNLPSFQGPLPLNRSLQKLCLLRTH